MKNIYYSTFTLYAGDSIMVAALVAGTLAAIGAYIRHTRRFLILDLDHDSLRNFAIWQIVWLMTGLILFKAIVIQGGPHIGRFLLTGDHGSVQFSTAGEAVSFAAMIFGLYRWGRWGINTARRIHE